MRLNHWSRAFYDVELEPETGRARRVWLSEARPHGAPLAGFAASERRVLGARCWFALYRAGDAILFQAGSRRWRTDDPAVRFAHHRLLPALSRFAVYVHDRCAFSITYAHAGRLFFAVIDPTYDGIDQESDFFLEFVAEHAGSASWREQVLGIWRDGAAGGAPAGP